MKRLLHPSRCQALCLFFILPSSIRVSHCHPDRRSRKLHPRLLLRRPCPADPESGPTILPLSFPVFPDPACPFLLPCCFCRLFTGFLSRNPWMHCLSSPGFFPDSLCFFHQNEKVTKKCFDLSGSLMLFVPDAFRRFTRSFLGPPAQFLPAISHSNFCQQNYNSFPFFLQAVSYPITPDLSSENPPASDAAANRFPLKVILFQPFRSDDIP